MKIKKESQHRILSGRHKESADVVNMVYFDSIVTVDCGTFQFFLTLFQIGKVRISFFTAHVSTSLV